MQVLAKYIADNDVVWWRIVEEDVAIALQEILITYFGEVSEFYLEIEDLSGDCPDCEFCPEDATTGATIQFTRDVNCWLKTMGILLPSIQEDEEFEEIEVLPGFFLTLIAQVKEISPGECNFHGEIDDAGNEVDPLDWQDIVVKDEV